MNHNANSKSHGYTLGMNKFGDLTQEEFKNQYLGLLPSQGYTSKTNQILNDVSNNTETSKPSLPVYLDWREKGIITGVKDQGKCKASWAFSSIATIESVLRINGRTSDLLSEQQLIDWTDTSQYQNEGCSGGRVPPCFDYAHVQSLCTSQDYPYVGVDDNWRDWKMCHTSYYVKGYVQVQTMNRLGLYTALTQQPVSIAVDAANLGWQFYQGGILGSGWSTDLNHSVTAVGYNNYVYFWYWPYDYLIVKNSWGSSWGNGGYLYLNTNNQDYPGTWGAYMQMYYPLIN